MWKPGKLTPQEYDEIKQHPVIGERIVASIEPFRRLCPAVRHHHERYDGKGYPDGLSGEAIPMLARVLGVADALDAMMSPRRYRPARSPIEIDAVVTHETGKQFDPVVVAAFMAVRTQIYPPIYQKGIGESAYHAIETMVDNQTETSAPVATEEVVGVTPGGERWPSRSHRLRSRPNHEIPSDYTCEGADISPALAWSGVPAGTKCLVLIVDDPDAPDPAAPKMTWVHWVLYNLPADSKGLPEAVERDDLPPGTREGKNDWKKTGYGGPCPPIGRHRYFFKLFALDAALPDMGAPTKAEVEKAMQGHVLEKAELIGLYQKMRK